MSCANAGDNSKEGNCAVSSMEPWDRFYAQKRGYKDRHNLRAAFPELMTDEVRADPKKWHPPLEMRPGDEVPGPKQGMTVVLEVGAGVGNACFPLLRANANLFCYAFDW
mmetsp:Transcript_29341/g.71423  ORF Transcript_29341/g.71423 Transcript_29341/m.71423 type:complete len:109 (-) Transcript_29341:329-655(-)